MLLGQLKVTWQQILTADRAIHDSNTVISRSYLSVAADDY